MYRLFKTMNSPKKMKSKALAFVFVVGAISLTSVALAQVDNKYISVYFLHGSRPLKKAENPGPKWFGGVHGGHVGIGISEDSILHFVPSGDFHVFAHKKQINGAFRIDDKERFFRIFPLNNDSVQTTTIQIPIEAPEVVVLKNLMRNYIDKCPYDYAFFGMRCGSAAWDILSQIGKTRQYGKGKTAMKIFYPKILRRKLLVIAEDQEWKVIRTMGTKSRKWER